MSTEDKTYRSSGVRFKTFVTGAMKLRYRSAAYGKTAAGIEGDQGHYKAVTSFHAQHEGLLLPRTKLQKAAVTGVSKFWHGGYY